MKNRTSQESKYSHATTGSQCLLLIVTVIALLSLAACNGPVKTVSYSNQPTATSSVCLEGIWSIRQPETFYKYSLPPGSFDLTTLIYKDSGGGIGYRFDSKGVLTVEAVGFTGNFDIKQGSETLPLEIKMNGFASGTYTINGDTVMLNKVLTSAIDYSATYDGEPMMNTKQINEFAPLFLSPYTTAKFECTSDKLMLQILNFPGYQEKIEFQRLIQ
jgi:hypothetical protein